MSVFVPQVYSQAIAIAEVDGNIIDPSGQFTRTLK
jgi:hypothetical protein